MTDEETRLKCLEIAVTASGFGVNKVELAKEFYKWVTEGRLQASAQGKAQRR